MVEICEGMMCASSSGSLNSQVKRPFTYRVLRHALRPVLLSILFMVHAGLFAQVDTKLDGRTYEGTGKAEPMEGCEGCGNRGTVRFLPGARVDYLLPGSDMMDRRAYTRDGDLLLLEGGRVSMELHGDTLYVHFNGLVHTYSRVSDRQH